MTCDMFPSVAIVTLYKSGKLRVEVFANRTIHIVIFLLVFAFVCVIMIFIAIFIFCVLLFLFVLLFFSILSILVGYSSRSRKDIMQCIIRVLRTRCRCGTEWGCKSARVLTFRQCDTGPRRVSGSTQFAECIRAICAIRLCQQLITCTQYMVPARLGYRRTSCARA